MNLIKMPRYSFGIFLFKKLERPLCNITIRIALHRIMRVELFFIVFFLFSTAFAQERAGDLIKLETQLENQLNALRQASGDEEIKKKNEQFKATLSEALSIEGAFDHPFQNLTTVGKIYSDDRLVRIISWNIQFENKLHDYECFIMKKDERRDKVSVVELKRVKQHFGMLRDETVTHENWYGCLYYDIIDVKKRNRTYYTLLGYDANNQRSSIKLIDVLYFTGKYPNFGYPLFETERRFVKRVIFEHSNKATMSLKYDEQRKKIIFDHLSPESPGMKDFREFYVPDLSYDAYEFRDNKWFLIEDIIAINNEAAEKVEIRSYDAANDTVISYQKDNEWVNPEGKDAPVDGGSHKAALPDDVIEGDKSKDKKKKQKKKKRSKKKGFSGVSFSNLGKEKN